MSKQLKLDFLRFIGTVLSLVFMAGVMYASTKASMNGMQGEIKMINENVIEIKADVKDLDGSQQDLKNRLIRVETKIENGK